MSRFLLQTILRSVRKERALKSQIKGMWGAIAKQGAVRLQRHAPKTQVGCNRKEKGGVKTQRWGRIAKKTAPKTQRWGKNAKNSLAESAMARTIKKTLFTGSYVCCVSFLFYFGGTSGRMKCCRLLLQHCFRCIFSAFSCL